MAEYHTCRSCMRSKNSGAFDVIPETGRPTCKVCKAKINKMTVPPELEGKKTQLTKENLENHRVKKNMRERETSAKILMKILDI